MNDPHQKLESLERWSAHATLLIFLGIVIEIGLLFWFPHNAQERIGAITADAFIGTGLIVEYIVILRAIVASGEAERLSNEKIAESNRIAAEAQLELAKFRATRRSILSGHEASLTEKLKAFPGTEFDSDSRTEMERQCISRGICILRLSRRDGCIFHGWILGRNCTKAIAPRLGK